MVALDKMDASHSVNENGLIEWTGVRVSNCVNFISSIEMDTDP